MFIGDQTIGIATDAEVAKPGRILRDERKYKRFFYEHGVQAIIVRPDYYVYGAVKTLADLPQLAKTPDSRLSLAMLSSDRQSQQQDV